MKFLKKKGRGNMKGKRVFKLNNSNGRKGENRKCVNVLYICDRLRRNK
jgi:hypothetical protein